jgi:hypothetical protein
MRVMFKPANQVLYKNVWIVHRVRHDDITTYFSMFEKEKVLDYLKEFFSSMKTHYGVNFAISLHEQEDIDYFTIWSYNRIFEV